MLGYLEVLGVTVFTHIERKIISNTTSTTSSSSTPKPQPPKRVASLKSYGLLTFLLMSSSSLSNTSLNYINYPTKVIFRSCKLLPTMALAVLINAKTFTALEYTCALSICVGLVIYAFSDSQDPATFSPHGVLLVCLSVLADAALPNAQERLFKLGASRSEVTYYTNVLVLTAMTVAAGGGGDLKATVFFCWDNPGVGPYLMGYTVVSYLAVTAHMMTIKRFEAVTAVLVGTGRKAVTIFVSFLVFPKPMGWGHVVGTALVLGGITGNGLGKGKRKGKGKYYDKGKGGGGISKRGRSGSGGV